MVDEVWYLLLGALLFTIGALGVLARLRSVLTERRVWWFAALQAATTSIAVGWMLYGRRFVAAVNGAALVGFAIAWVITGRRPRPPASNAR